MTWLKNQNMVEKLDNTTYANFEEKIGVIVNTKIFQKRTLNKNTHKRIIVFPLFNWT